MTDKHANDDGSCSSSGDETIDPTKTPELPHRRTDAASFQSNFSEQVVRYFGEYELQQEVGRGGMGIVFKAKQRKLNRVVALKMILSGAFASKEQVERFQTEARAVAKLNHPDIVQIFEIGEHEGHHYFSMAFVNGHSLKEEVSNGPLQPKRAAEIVARISSAVAHANANKIIHRDLKPANILIDLNDNIKVSDFGLAKELGAGGSTSSGGVLGTPNYMAPEQAAGRTSAIDSTSDVYAIGAILYELLTGRPPFQAANPVDVLQQILNKDPVPPRALIPNIPRDLENICLKCLEKDQRRRYKSGDLLAADIRRWIDGFPVEAKPVSFLLRIAKWSMRNPAWAAATAILSVLFCTFSMMAIANIEAYIEASEQAFIVVLICSVFAGLFTIFWRFNETGGPPTRTELTTILLCLTVFFVGGIGLLSLPITFLLHLLR